MTSKPVPKLPRGLSGATKVAPTTTATWYRAESIERQARKGTGFTYRKGRIWLGRTATDSAEPVAWMDDRHMMTIAGSRTGKGTSAIIPTLCTYPYSVLCIDPKGENAKRTAARRGIGTSQIDGMCQDVYVLDPYGISKVEQQYLATFDPLAGLSPDSDDSLEEAGLIADALVVSSNPRDEHFDHSARSFIEALILHVLTWPDYEGERTLGQVRKLLRDGDRAEHQHLLNGLSADEKMLPEHKAVLARATPFDMLLQLMEENEAFEGVISGAASGLKDLGDRERGSVLSTARRNLKFLDSKKMQSCLTESTHTLHLEELKRAENYASVYIVLPSRFMKTHARWMRLIMNLTIARMEADPTPIPKERPVLAICDEFPTLGHMAVLESAIGYMAGFGLKIWSIIQDLSQLKRDYPASWETFLGNAGLIQCFGNADQTTLEYISKRLGEIEVIREVNNRSETYSKGVSDLSEFEKVARTAEKGLGEFALQNDTKTRSENTATAENTSQSLQKAHLLTPEEIRRYTSRGSAMQIVLLADYRPLYLRRTAYFEDRFFDGLYYDDSRDLVARHNSA